MAARNFTEEWLNGRVDKARVNKPARETTYDVVEISLPFPPSVNGMYANVPNRGRVKTLRYRTWETAADWDVARQRPKRIEGPVELNIYLEDSTATRGDADNRIKPVSDYLVSKGIIEGDQKKFVRKITVAWSAETRGCRVSIRPAPVHEGAI